MPRTPEMVEVGSREEWRAWLAEHHQQKEGILLVTYRKGTSERYIPYEEIVEEALCFGWIDSTRRKLDDERTTLLVTPRKPNSGWSQVNKERVERLIEAGRMTPMGLAVIERAKANDSWTRFDEAAALKVPEDLSGALASQPAAEANFNAFPPLSRREMLQWVFDAKRPETRSARVREIVEKAAKGERAR